MSDNLAKSIFEGIDALFWISAQCTVAGIFVNNGVLGYDLFHRLAYASHAIDFLWFGCSLVYVYMPITPWCSLQIMSAHIRDEFEFLLDILVQVTVRPLKSTGKRLAETHRSVQGRSRRRDNLCCTAIQLYQMDAQVSLCSLFHPIWIAALCHLEIKILK